ncbi:ADP-ribosylglycohydrolase family protein [Nocardioides sp. AX2bis]|uniref:ADP-ribosylglycohydrolase family protein n=1 Tax=Nocardioides sp. AX2bis TaxID=2653157 RepID=UPI0012F2E074|nr:ADP-ribosylglycohydrolase family protein [Nocardioides sp. AX2bis]VXC09911.1 hypothetical protein NOCARDAX2BIS_420033 [Nocardioides sp. AX2bis]
MASVTDGLDDQQSDRAAGVLIGQACGDALGVPYEAGTPPGPGEPAEMKGGGIGDLAPGEWSDDTALAVAIADVAATGADLTTPEALDAIATGFLAFLDSGPAQIGEQTAAVLGATRDRLTDHVAPAALMTQVAADYAAEHQDEDEHVAGTGALMRTSAVALAHLDDRVKLAAAARAVAALTHADPLAAESCVLWCEAIRVAVVGGQTDVRGGLDLLPPGRRADWARWIDDALIGPSSNFTANGSTVAALQAATSAIVLTPASHGHAGDHLQDALHAAVRIGDDTDTIAAIAGALLGAKWGASSVPEEWAERVHGWPGRTGADLVSLARVAAQGGSGAALA